MDATGGYGQFVSAIARGLARKGHQIHARPSMPELESAPGVDELVSSGGSKDLIIHPPDCIAQMMRPGVPTAVMTMWESSRLRPEWIPVLNRARVVIVPNEWNASCFSAQGVDVPIRVVGLGCDKSVFKPDRFAYRNRGLGPFRVGVAGRWASGGERKGIAEAVEAFEEAFQSSGDWAELEVKCFSECRVEAPNDDPRVKIIRDKLTLGQMGDWYRSLSAFLSLAKSEGWGLHQHQAMMCGVPLISPRFAGVAEFFTGREGWVVDHKLAPATGYYDKLGVWCEPSITHAAQCLRSAYNEWVGGVTSMGSPWLYATMASKWDEERMVGGVEAVLREFQLL